MEVHISFSWPTLFVYLDAWMKGKKKKIKWRITKNCLAALYKSDYWGIIVCLLLSGRSHCTGEAWGSWVVWGGDSVRKGYWVRGRVQTTFDLWRLDGPAMRWVISPDWGGGWVSAWLKWLEGGGEGEGREDWVWRRATVACLGSHVSSPILPLLPYSISCSRPPFLPSPAQHSDTSPIHPGTVCLPFTLSYYTRPPFISLLYPLRRTPRLSSLSLSGTTWQAEAIDDTLMMLNTAHRVSTASPPWKSRSHIFIFCWGSPLYICLPEHLSIGVLKTKITNMHLLLTRHM